MRLVGEKPEQNAGGDRVSFQQNQRAADEARGQKSVLPDDEIGQHRREGGGEQITHAVADDGADRDEISGERRERPKRVSCRIGQQGEEDRDKQKGRRIVPAEIAVEGMADGGLLHQLVCRPIIGRGGVTG